MGARGRVARCGTRRKERAHERDKAHGTEERGEWEVQVVCVSTMRTLDNLAEGGEGLLEAAVGDAPGEGADEELGRHGGWWAGGRTGRERTSKEKSGDGKRRKVSVRRQTASGRTGSPAEASQGGRWSDVRRAVEQRRNQGRTRGGGRTAAEPQQNSGRTAADGRRRPHGHMTHCARGTNYDLKTI